MQIIPLFPGVTLRHFPDNRFKNGSLSLQFVGPMARETAALNALLPAVLLRGCRNYPDLQTITFRLDELYGASAGTLVRRVGDLQTTGFYCGFMDDRYAPEGEGIFQPMVDLIAQLLLEPVLEKGAFRADFVESEKKNLIATIESQLNDKRAYANARMFETMCREDSFGIPRLGTVETVQAITAESLYKHYLRVLREYPVQIFYVGSQSPEEVAWLLKQKLAGIALQATPLPGQTAFRDAGESRLSETMSVAQGKLAMGYVTPITIRDDRFVAMQVLNMVFGGGLTSKLFMHIREKLSLCYAIGSSFHGSKGILTVSAGIDSDKEQLVCDQIAGQLDACCRGEISERELAAAKEGLSSSLRAVHDSPGAIENFYASAALSGLKLSVSEYRAAVEAVTAEQVAEVARTLRLHTVYFLRGASQ